MADTRREWINKDNKDIAVEHVLFIYTKQVISRHKNTHGKKYINTHTIYCRRTPRYSLPLNLRWRVIHKWRLRAYRQRSHKYTHGSIMGVRDVRACSGLMGHVRAGLVDRSHTHQVSWGDALLVGIRRARSGRWSARATCGSSRALSSWTHTRLGDLGFASRWNNLTQQGGTRAIYRVEGGISRGSKVSVMAGQSVELAGR